MTEARLEPITGAGLLVTDWCPARCRHCYVRAGPDGRAWMPLDAAREHLAALARMGVPAEGVHVGGGEPFGDFDRLLAIVRAARDAGLDGLGYVETNGFWADGEAVIRERLGALANAGMRQLSISADPYHQEFVRPDRVRLLYAVAREVLGPAGVRARRWKWLQSLEDVAEMAEPARTHLFTDFLQRYPERMTGRAAEALAPLAERVPMTHLPDTPCRPALLAGRHVHVDPEGWVYPGTCAGIVLGRAGGPVPLGAVLRGWALDASPLVRHLVEGGPKGLLPMAEPHDFRPDAAGYAGKCHLCWSIRAHLVRSGAGGGTLEPRRLYLPR